MILFVLAAVAVLAVVAVVLCYRGTLYTSPEERRIRSLKPLNHEPDDDAYTIESFGHLIGHLAERLTDADGWGTKGRLR